MNTSDWIWLAGISVVVAVCGVIGVSYVEGEGYPTFTASQTYVYCVIFTILTGIILFFFDLLINLFAGRLFDSVKGEGEGGSVDFAKNASASRINNRADSSLLDDSRHQRRHRRRASARVGAQQSARTTAARARGGRCVGRAAARLRATFPERSLFDAVTPDWRVRSVLLFAGIMCIFWLPWYIANYPGGTYWDTYYQIFQVYPENHPIAIIPWGDIYDQTLTDAWLVDHHPILTTLLYGAFGWGSDQLTGNWMAGVAIFCALQGIAHCVAFSAAIAWLKERNCPPALCFAIYLFLSVMPFISTWAMCMVKDSLFGVLFVPYIIMLIDAVRTRGRSIMSWRKIALFGFLAALLCLTKKQGIYVVVPTALIGAWLLRPSKVRMDWNILSVATLGDCKIAPSQLRARIRARRMQATSTARDSKLPCIGFLYQAVICVVVMCLVMPYIVFPLLNVAPGGKQEALGTLFQQTARYVYDYPNDVTPEERAAIEAVIDYDELATSYEWDFQDSVKYRYNLDATLGDLAQYALVYGEMGLRHPDSYFGAVACLAGFYLAPTAFANIRMVTVDTKMGDDQRYMLWNPDELDWLRLGLDSVYYWLGDAAGVNVPLLIVTYVFWLPAALLYVAKRRRLRAGLLFIPFAVLLAFCIVAPVYDARYCVPIFDCVMFLFAAIVVLVKDGPPTFTKPFA
jgi:hypothetical protein